MKAVKLEVQSAKMFLILHAPGKGLLMGEMPGANPRKVAPWGSVCSCCCSENFKNEIKSAAAAHGVTEVLFESPEHWAIRCRENLRFILEWELEWMASL